MDIWKYYGITHRDHVVCNPLSEAKVDRLVDLLNLGPESKILDIACGKAELTCRIAERYGAECTGIDISPYEVRAAKAKVRELGLSDQVTIIEGAGSEHEAPDHSHDLTLCIGASFVFGGYRPSLEAMIRLTAPGGLIAIGEPFKMKEPDAVYAAAEPDFVPTLVTHADNVEIAQEHSLTFLYAIVSNQDDWDRYEGLQTLAAETYALEHPDDPDVPELLERRRRTDETYLKWGRDTLNWAIYLFRTPESG